MIMSDVANVVTAAPPELAADQRTCHACGSMDKANEAICAQCGARPRKPVNKTALLLFAFFLGGIGAHKFYLGKVWQGALCVLFSWTLIPTIVALIEFVIYVFTTPVRLSEKYSARTSPLTIFLIAAGFLIMLVGLAAIAISSFNDYKTRGKVADGMTLAASVKIAIGESFATNGPADMTCRPGDCSLDVANLGPTSYVRRISSDRAGAITIEFDEQVARAPQNRLSFIPQIDGKKADLSDPKSAGKSVKWKCGQDVATTIVPDHLPTSCR